MKDENLVIIDADSLVYLVGFNLKSIQIEPLGIAALDDIIIGILSKTASPNYMGFFGLAGGRNFRYDIATTRPYKEARNKQKAREAETRTKLIADGKYVEEDWFAFWEPVLKTHMEVYWKFQSVDKIEADDAVIIAKHKYLDDYAKVIIASPDKDLAQDPGWLYDYKKVVLVNMGEQEAYRALAVQLIMGDSADSIPGLPGAGDKLALELLTDFIYTTDEKFRDDMIDIYIEYFTTTLANKALVKQEKVFFLEYKAKHGFKTMTKARKDEARQVFEFVPEPTHNKKYAKTYFEEMFALLSMLNTEKAGEMYDFKVGPVHTSANLKLQDALDFKEELVLEDEEIEFDFLDDL